MIILGILLLLSLPAYAIDIDDREPGFAFSNQAGLGWHELLVSSGNQGDTLRTFNNGAWAKFAPTITAGTYDVYMRWPTWSLHLPDNAAAAIVKHASGQQAIAINQQQNGGKWNLLGRWVFDTTAAITITNRGAGPVYADAVRFIPAENPCITGPPPPGKLPVVGININQFAGSFDSAGQGFVKDLGAHSIRVGYAHGDHDFAVKWAAENGVGVVFMLGYSKGCDPITAAGRQCYADRSANLAKTYGSKVQYYEVWNEWNGGYGFGQTCVGQPCNDLVMYTDLLCRTYRAVKAVQPNAIIVGGVTSGVDIPWTTKMFDAGAGKCMDAISVHPYVHTQKAHSVPYNSSVSVGVAKFVEAITAQDNLVRQKTGRSIQMLITEEGWSSSYQEADVRTAGYITELYKRVASIPFVVGIWWYSLEDFGGDGYGVLRSNNTKKPAYAAFKATASTAISPSGSIRDRLRPPPPRPYY